MKPQNYIVIFNDGSHLYLNANDGPKALEQWFNGRNIVARGQGFSHSSVKRIRPCKYGEETEVADRECKRYERSLSLPEPKKDTVQLLEKDNIGSNIRTWIKNNPSEWGKKIKKASDMLEKNDYYNNSSKIVRKSMSELHARFLVKSLIGS